MWNGVADNNAEGTHAAKAEGELENGDSSLAVLTEAMLHDFDVGDTAAELCIEYDKSNRPVCEERETDEKDQWNDEGEAWWGSDTAPSYRNAT